MASKTDIVNPSRKQESTPLLVNTNDVSEISEIERGEQEVPWAVRHQSCLGAVVIFINSFFLFSVMLADEMVAAAVPELKRTMEIDSVVIGIIYSSSYIPSILFVLLGGIFVSKIGVRTLSFVSSLLLIAGIVIFAMVETVWGKILGRICFGLGLGPIELVNDVIIVRWFDDKSFPSVEAAFSVLSMMGMFGSVVGFNVVPALFDYFKEHYTPVTTLQMALLTLGLIPALSFVFNVVFNVIDYYAAPHLSLESEEEEPGILETVKDLKIGYWLFWITIAFTFTQIYSFMLYTTDYLQEKFHIDLATAGLYSSTVYGIGIIVSPITGYIIHKYGKLPLMLFLGSLSFGCGSLLIGATHLHPMIGMSAVGVGLGFIEVSVWTGTQEVVSDHAIGPAYAFLSVAMSTVLLVVPFGAGWLRDHFGTYDYGSFVCSGSSVVGMACAIALYIVEPKLQNPSEVYKKFYIVRVAMRKKAQTRRKLNEKRHSITVGEVPYLRQYIEQTKGQKVGDLLSAQQSQPRLVGTLEEYHSPSIIGPKVVTKGPLSASLPSDFWSTVVTKEINVKEVDASQIDVMSEIATLYETQASDVTDVAALWQEEDSAATATTSTATTSTTATTTTTAASETTSVTEDVGLTDSHSITKDKKD